MTVQRKVASGLHRPDRSASRTFADGRPFGVMPIEDWIWATAARVLAPMAPSGTPTSKPRRVSSSWSSRRSARDRPGSSVGQAASDAGRRRAAGRTGGRWRARSSRRRCRHRSRRSCASPGKRARRPRRAAAGRPSRRRAAPPSTRRTPRPDQVEKGFFFVRPASAGIEAWREAHLEAPCRPGHPAGLAQIVGGGAQRVGDRVHHVPPSVTVEIDGEAQEGRGHELRVAEGAGPGSRELGRVACRRALQDLQRGDELALEIVLPRPAVAGERRQRLHQRPFADRLP